MQIFLGYTSKNAHGRKNLLSLSCANKKKLITICADAESGMEFFMNRNRKRVSKKDIHKKIFYTQLILIVSLALFLGIAGTLININFETQKRDRNLQNIAEAVATSPLLENIANTPLSENENDILTEYLDSLKVSLDNIDVISVVNSDSMRLYHSNHSLIGTHYDGTLPNFENTQKKYYTVNETGPSGSQRRAYAAVYDQNGNYIGFVMAILLTSNIKAQTFHILLIFALITIAAVLFELMISAELSGSIKKSLNGYEPDVFSAMFKIRDNVLESLNEGVIATNINLTVQFANRSAANMFGKQDAKQIMGMPFSDFCNDSCIKNVIKTGNKEFNIRIQGLENTNVLIDCVPIRRDDEIIGAIAILHNREEYTALMEDLAGTRFLVDSMRANNHDFTNKLHVILGLIQMEMYDEAVSYIENISIVQRETISKIMSVVDDASIAALLIGKTARASELNIKFILKDDSSYSKDDLPLPAEIMITVIGNLIDNAYDSMNIDTKQTKELIFGIYSRPDNVLISVEDTGVGISQENINRIFDNGFSTKGSGRGTGLFCVKEMIDSLGGKIYITSEENKGTMFTVKISKQNDGSVQKNV